MAFSTRYFVVEHDGSLKSVPRRVVDGIIFGFDRLPDYPSQRVRIIEAIVENQGGKPVRLLNARGAFWEFDQQGRRVSDDEAFRLVFDSRHTGAVAHSERVVSMTERRAQQRFHSEHRWNPTPKEITAVVHAIWPEQAGKGKARRIPKVTNTAPPRPSLTYRAQEARQKLVEAHTDARLAISDLTREDLRGLAPRLREDSEDDPMDPIGPRLWSGMADAAEKQLEIRKAWKREKGVWYAIAEMSTRSPDPRIWDLHMLECVQCSRKSEAVDRARELLKKHADKFSEGSTVEVEIRPAEEWEPPEDED